MDLDLQPNINYFQFSSNQHLFPFGFEEKLIQNLRDLAKTSKLALQDDELNIAQQSHYYVNKQYSHPKQPNFLKTIASAPEVNHTICNFLIMSNRLRVL